MRFERKVKRNAIKKHLGFKGAATMKERLQKLQSVRSFVKEKKEVATRAYNWRKRHGIVE